jgi:hypothetical protein
MIRGFFLILIVFLFACSKEKRAYNKLDGIWEVTQARIVDGQGFTFYDDSPSGTIEFIENTKVCSATFAFSYENLSEVPLIIYDTLDYNSATFILNNKGGENSSIIIGRVTRIILDRIDINDQSNKDFKDFRIETR